MNSKLFITLLFSIFLLSSISATDISTCEELQNMSLNLNDNYTLLNNIDCSDTINWNGGNGWLPVGDSSNHFLGNFDGVGFNITDLFINRNETNYQGLFGYAGDTGDNGTQYSIQNVGLLNVNITGYNQVGALCGYAEEIDILNSYSTGNIVGNYQVGGLIGEHFDNGLDSMCSENCGIGNLTNSSSSVNVQGNGDTGGLVGKIIGTYLKNSYATGNVIGINDLSYGYEVGGLVGWARFSSILNSYSTGNVSGDAYEVGGLVGGFYSSSVINNSYATGEVNGTSDIAGLVGYSTTENIDNSYSVGKVTSVGTTGGLVSTGAGDYLNSFWDINTSGQLTSSGGVGKTTEEMKVLPTFSNWTIVTTDVDLNNGYPYLLNGVWFLYFVSPEEVAQQFSDTGQAIYNILNGFGAGFGIFLQILGQALPFLLVGLLMVFLIVMFVRELIKLFETI